MFAYRKLNCPSTDSPPSSIGLAMTSVTNDLTSVFDTIYESNAWTHVPGLVRLQVLIDR